MNPRQKCAQCGIFAIFQDDFCTSCWSHRTKGKVLTSEQIASCKKEFAAVNEKKRWQAEFDSWQNRLLIPSILMTLWCLYGVSLLLPLYLRDGDGQFEIVTCILGAASFAGGGYLVGGARSLQIACPLLIIASLVATFHIGDYLLNVMNGQVLQSETNIGKGLLFSAIRLIFCGTIIVSSVMILRLKRPTA